MSERPYVRGYTDYTAWESDWRGLVVNERPIVQRVAEPTSLLSLKPDRDLIGFFRAHHHMHIPSEGGDVMVEHRLATHGPSASAKAITQYRWSTLITYTMTLVYTLPNALPWLQPVLAAGGCWCSCAPRPDLGLLWLPAPEGLDVHLILIAAMFSAARKGARK